MGNISSKLDTLIYGEDNIIDAREILEEITEAMEKVKFKEVDNKNSVLTPIKEHHNSPTHFSNLHNNEKKEYKIEQKPITQYPKSYLTTFKKLKHRRFFGFFV